MTDLSGNDVSLYSCALGAYLSGRPFRVAVQDSNLAWLGDWLQPGLPALATLLLCTSALEFYGRDNPYHRRMWNAYPRRWPDLHAKARANLEKGLAGVSLRHFYAGDVVDFFANAPPESVVISFPPTSPRLSMPPVEGPASLITLSQEQLNTLRSEYLSLSIVPAPRCSSASRSGCSRR